MFIVEHIAGHRRRSFFPITDCGITHWEHLGVRPICGGERARVGGDGHEKSLYRPRLLSLDCCAWVRVRHWHYSHTPLSFLAGASTLVLLASRRSVVSAQQARRALTTSAAHCTNNSAPRSDFGGQRGHIVVKLRTNKGPRDRPCRPHPRAGTSPRDFFAALHNVRLWHKADISRLSSNVRFWGLSGHHSNLPQ